MDGARERAEKGELLFGTVETWLIWKLTKGAVHVTDYSNASLRTMLFNINTLQWDDEILAESFRIPKMYAARGETVELCVRSDGYHPSWAVRFPLRARRLCDQQAALFGQTCFEPGEAKNIYGTGCFMLMNTGEKPVFSDNGLVTTIAGGLDGKVNYAACRGDPSSRQARPFSGCGMSFVSSIPHRIPSIWRKRCRIPTAANGGACV